MSNELGRLDSGVGYRMTSRIEIIFLSKRIESQQEGSQHMPMQSVITDHSRMTLTVCDSPLLYIHICTYIFALF